MKNIVLKSILFGLLFWLPFLGNECTKLESGNSTIDTNNNIIGKWELVKMTGNSQDVCLGEIVDFQSNGNATLTCPGETPVQRTFTYSGNILTYTTNNLSYDVEFNIQNNIQKMILSGRNGVGRELTYDQISK